MRDFKSKIQRGMTHSMLTQGHPEHSRGMTAVELVIVIGIFSVIASMAMFNYKEFQSRVNIRSLSNDIALKVVEAQKSAISGKRHPSMSDSRTPAYGVAFNISAPTQFIYFADLDNSGTCTSGSGGNCTPAYSVGGEVVSIVTMTGGISIRTSPSGLEVSGGGCPATVNNFTIVFRRPNTSPIFDANPDFGCSPSYLGVNITSTQSVAGRVRIYSSGRVTMN